MHLLTLCHALLYPLTLLFLSLSLMCLSLALLFLLLLLQPFLLFFLQFLQSLLPFFLLLHYFPHPPLMLLPRQYLLKLYSRLALLLAALLILPSDLLIQILNFFCDIFSFGLDLDFLLFLIGQLRWWHCLFRQCGCILNDKEHTSGITKDPFSKLIAIFSIELKPCFYPSASLGPVS